MKGRIKVQVCAVGFLAMSILHAPAFAAPASSPQASSPQKAVPKASPYSVSEPYCNNNLSVFLIRGPEKLKGQEILTLEEALAKKFVKVAETSNVNQLSIENNSDKVVFLQSGDVVRGGKQDRAIQYDMMLQPKAKAVPLQVFCVEHGRWQQRGFESSGAFDSSSNSLSGKDLKLAAKKSGDQSSVWNNVSQIQAKLSRRLGNVCAPPSPSSYELTMDNNNVKNSTNVVMQKFGPLADEKDVVGFAFAINGKINSADVYANNQLFKKLWPKLLKSAAAEAIAEAGPSKTPSPVAAPKKDAVQKFLADAEDKPVVRKAGGAISEMTEQESGKSLLYKTRWYSAPRQAQVVDSRPIVRDSRSAGAAGTAGYSDVHINYMSK